MKNKFAVVFWLTVVYFFIELIGGLYFNSLALVTDASFMVVNILGQLITNYVIWLSRKPPNNHMTFGYERAKVLSGLFNGMALGFVLFYVLINAYHRIVVPQPLDAANVFFIALIGLVINVFNLFVLYKRSNDINIKGAFLLILNDTLGSVGVIISAVVIKYTELYFIDGVTSIFIGLLIIYPTHKLIAGSIYILMEGIPTGIEVEVIERFILATFPEIVHIKDLHVWAIVPEKILLAAKLRTNGNVYHRENIKAMKKKLKATFGFYDVYIEVYENNEVQN